MLEVKDVRLRFVRKPTRCFVSIDRTTFAGTAAAHLRSEPLEVEAEVDLAGDRASIHPRARLGFGQIEEAEVRRLIYRGKGMDDGWLELLMDEPPARAVGPCRDGYHANDMFAYPPNSQTFEDGYTMRYPGNIVLSTIGSLPTTVMVSQYDAPYMKIQTSLHNMLTDKDNFITSAHMKMPFYTVLLIDKGDGDVDILGFFKWLLEWKVQFHVSPWRQLDDVKAASIVSRVNVGPFFRGEFSDLSVASVLLEPHSPTCNRLTEQAGANAIIIPHRT